MAELLVHGVGVAVADPELRQVGQASNMVCTVTLAFNRSYQTKDKQWQQEACFVRAIGWGSRAERMAAQITKGQPVYVSGYLKQDSWQAKDGQKRINYSITLSDLQLCVKNGHKQEQSPKESTPINTTESVQVNQDDELPF